MIKLKGRNPYPTHEPRDPNTLPPPTLSPQEKLTRLQIQKLELEIELLKKLKEDQDAI